MMQLILDVGGYAVALPESKKGGFLVREETLHEQIEMISGRTVREYRGKVWVISYQYGYFNDEDVKRVVAACEKGMQQSILCSFISHESYELQTTNFIVTAFTRPKFMWSRTTESGAAPLWADFSVELREVRPHA